MDTTIPHDGECGESGADMTKNEICHQMGIWPYITDPKEKAERNRELTEEEAEEWRKDMEEVLEIVKKYNSNS